MFKNARINPRILENVAPCEEALKSEVSSDSFLFVIASLEMISGDDTQISSLFHTWLTHEMIGLNFLNAMKRDMAFIWHSRVLRLKYVITCKL